MSGFFNYELRENFYYVAENLVTRLAYQSRELSGCTVIKNTYREMGFIDDKENITLEAIAFIKKEIETITLVLSESLLQQKHLEILVNNIAESALQKFLVNLELTKPLSL